MKLDKISETILKCAIKKCENNPNSEVEISHKDFSNPKISNSLINAVCSELLKKDYIFPYYESRANNDTTKITLTYKGFTYFEYKRIDSIQTFKNSIILPIVVTIVTQILIAALKYLLPYILQMLK